MSIVQDMAKDIGIAAAEALAKRRAQLPLEPHPNYVALTALGWATATQALFCGMTEEEIMAAFKRTLEQVREGLAAGKGNITFVEVDITPEAKA